MRRIVWTLVLLVPALVVGPFSIFAQQEPSERRDPPRDEREERPPGREDGERERRPDLDRPAPERHQPARRPDGQAGPGARMMMRPLAGMPGMPAPERMEALRQMDPEMYELVTKDMELERRSHEMARRARLTSKEEDRERAREQLLKLAREHFEVRQQRRELHLERLEQEIKHLRESHEKRAKMQDEVIERRVNELLGKRDDLDF